MTTEQIQKLIGAVPDGNFGPKSLEALKVWLDKLGGALTAVAARHPELTPVIEDAFLKTRPASSMEPVEDEPVKFHKRTEDNLETLSPETRKLARRFIRRANTELMPPRWEVRIISGTRTYDEQDALYAQGRNRPGKIVTNARGGYSHHNFGVAFDVGVFFNDEYQPESIFYEKLGPLGEAVGLEWGGRWEGLKDLPHFELKTGLNLAQLRQRKAQGLPIG